MNMTLNNLSRILPRENAVKLELEQGVIIFRASAVLQERVEELLEKEKESSLSPEETDELNAYAEIDDYLSHVNRLIRNSAGNVELNLAA